MDSIFKHNPSDMYLISHLKGSIIFEKKQHKVENLQVMINSYIRSTFSNLNLLRIFGAVLCETLLDFDPYFFTCFYIPVL